MDTSHGPIDVEDAGQTSASHRVISSPFLTFHATAVTSLTSPIHAEGCSSDIYDNSGHPASSSRRYTVPIVSTTVPPISLLPAAMRASPTSSTEETSHVEAPTSSRAFATTESPPTSSIRRQRRGYQPTSLYIESTAAAGGPWASVTSAIAAGAAAGLGTTQSSFSESISARERHQRWSSSTRRGGEAAATITSSTSSKVINGSSAPVVTVLDGTSGSEVLTTATHALAGESGQQQLGRTSLKSSSLLRFQFGSPGGGLNGGVHGASGGTTATPLSSLRRTRLSTTSSGTATTTATTASTSTQATAYPALAAVSGADHLNRTRDVITVVPDTQDLEELRSVAAQLLKQWEAEVLVSNTFRRKYSNIANSMAAAATASTNTQSGASVSTLTPPDSQCNSVVNGSHETVWAQRPCSVSSTRSTGDGMCPATGAMTSVSPITVCASTPASRGLSRTVCTLSSMDSSGLTVSATEGVSAAVRTTLADPEATNEQLRQSLAQACMEASLLHQRLQQCEELLSAMKGRRTSQQEGAGTTAACTPFIPVSRVEKCNIICLPSPQHMCSPTLDTDNTSTTFSLMESKCVDTSRWSCAAVAGGSDNTAAEEKKDAEEREKKKCARINNSNDPMSAEVVVAKAVPQKSSPRSPMVDNDRECSVPADVLAVTTGESRAHTPEPELTGRPSTSPTAAAGNDLSPPPLPPQMKPTSTTSRGSRGSLLASTKLMVPGEEGTVRRTSRKEEMEGEETAAVPSTATASTPAIPVVVAAPEVPTAAISFGDIANRIREVELTKSAAAAAGPSFLSGEDVMLSTSARRHSRRREVRDAPTDSVAVSSSEASVDPPSSQLEASLLVLQKSTQNKSLSLSQANIFHSATPLSPPAKCQQHEHSGISPHASLNSAKQQGQVSSPPNGPATQKPLRATENVPSVRVGTTASPNILELTKFPEVYSSLVPAPPPGASPASLAANLESSSGPLGASTCNNGGGQGPMRLPTITVSVSRTNSLMNGSSGGRNVGGHFSVANASLSGTMVSTDDAFMLGPLGSSLGGNAGTFPPREDAALDTTSVNSHSLRSIHRRSLSSLNNGRLQPLQPSPTASIDVSLLHNIAPCTMGAVATAVSSSSATCVGGPLAATTTVGCSSHDGGGRKESITASTREEEAAVMRSQMVHLQEERERAAAAEESIGADAGRSMTDADRQREELRRWREEAAKLRGGISM